MVLLLVVNSEGELWVLGPAKVVNKEGLVNLEVVVNLLWVMINRRKPFETSQSGQLTECCQFDNSVRKLTFNLTS